METAAQGVSFVRREVPGKQATVGERAAGSRDFQIRMLERMAKRHENGGGKKHLQTSHNRYTLGLWERMDEVMSEFESIADANVSRCTLDTISHIEAPVFPNS